MTDKPEYYEVLGVSKEAGLDDIKKAFQKIVMRNHPDVIRNKPGLTEAQKNEAAKKFKEATEAHEVLSDAVKRAAYDKYGHKGVENLGAAGGRSGSGGQGPAHAPSPRKTYSTEDVFDFFDQRAGGGTTATPRREDGGERSDAAAERRRRREARRGHGGFGTGEEMPETSAAETPQAQKNPEPAATTVTEKFRETARDAEKMAEKMQGSGVPVEVLEQFRENLRDFIGELDKAIAKAKKQSGGPRF